MPSPFATVEDATDLRGERISFSASHIAAVAYGIHASIFAIVTYYTVRERLKHRRWILWLLFTCLLFVIGTINLACSIQFNEDAFVNERNYPNGPPAFFLKEQYRTVVTLENSAWIAATFLADGLLLYRMLIVWEFAWYIIAVPICLYLSWSVLLPFREKSQFLLSFLRLVLILSHTVMTILTVAKTAHPTTFLVTADIAFPAWVMLMVINILLTVMIAGRILLIQRSLQSALGSSYGKIYTSIVFIVVEASLPFTVVSIILLGMFGAKAPEKNIFIPLLVQVECIAQHLIILWVILGRAWSSDTMKIDTNQNTNTLRFHHTKTSIVDESDCPEVNGKECDIIAGTNSSATSSAEVVNTTSTSSGETKHSVVNIV